MTTGNAKVGLLGAGYILQAHAKAVQSTPNAELYAVCDLSKSRAQSAAEAYGIEHAFTSIEELCTSDVQSVHVLLPPALHLKAARQLLEAGKDVLLEKPMGIGSDECQAVVDLAKARGLKLGVSHNFLFTSAYEEVRRKLRAGEFGPLDHVHVQWLYALGLIQFGPYDNWMVREPQNLLFELGSHLGAFVMDLVGTPEVVHAEAGDAIDLPGNQRVYRQWMATLRAGRTSVQFAMSANPGYPERSLRIRGLGGAASVDFERNLATSSRVGSTSALFDNLGTSRAQGSALLAQGRSNFLRSFKGALKKDSTANGFHDSVQRAVACFYRTDQPLDKRVDGQFGVDVIRLCENIARAAGGDPSPSKQVAMFTSTADVEPTRAPDVLVIGGTGFIGKRLVQQLVAQGHGVRVLTRSRHSADIELGRYGVDIVQGHHGDAKLLDQILPETKVVIHLAKATGSKWQDYVDNDITPTRVLAEAALRHKVKRFIYTGTIDSYYSAGQGDVITGDTPLDAQMSKRNLYARSKAACEDMLSKLHKEQGLPLVTFRPGIVIGAGSPPAHWGVGMFHSDARVDLWGSDDHALPFVLVDDVADALVRGVTHAGIEGQTFLLTDAPVLTGNQYVQELEQLAGVKITVHRIPAWKHFAEDVVKEAIKNAIRHPNRKIPSFRDWDCRSHRARYDSSKTMQVLGWKPAGTRDGIVRDGIAAAVDHFYG
jgi:predicted dehydrogenase/nucleoside-diphosphate-sugar epimerase